MNKFFRILEIIWLVTAIGCAAITIYFLVTKDNDSALYFLFIFVIASIMFLLRRYQRVNQEKFNKKPGQKL